MSHIYILFFYIYVCKKKNSIYFTHVYKIAHTSYYHEECQAFWRALTGQNEVSNQKESKGVPSHSSSGFHFDHELRFLTVWSSTWFSACFAWVSFQLTYEVESCGSEWPYFQSLGIQATKWGKLRGRIQTCSIVTKHEAVFSRYLKIHSQVD